MNPQVTAADLHTVATEMRVKAYAASDGQWAAVEKIGDATGMDVLTVTGDTWGTVARDTADADAEHFVAWHPGVALAVADWLDGCADRYDLTSSARLEHDPAERDWYEPAVAVVRAWRGEQP